MRLSPFVDTLFLILTLFSFEKKLGNHNVSNGVGRWILDVIVLVHRLQDIPHFDVCTMLLSFVALGKLFQLCI